MQGYVAAENGERRSRRPASEVGLSSDFA